MRDIVNKPYSEDEKRVADYLTVITNGQIGAGDDPIGFLIASHRYQVQITKDLNAEIIAYEKLIDDFLGATASRVDRKNP